MIIEEIKKFKEENCKDCKKHIDCKIIKNINGELVCIEDRGD